MTNDSYVITVGRTNVVSTTIFRPRHHSPPPAPGAAFPVQREATMRLDHKPLRDQIADASHELKLARRDGSAEWIERAAEKLDVLIDRIPRTAQSQGTAP